MEIVFLAFILILSIFLGFELINKVPATLHTPLMSGSIVSAGSAHTELATILGTAAVAFATINVVGGYLVTDRMLGMFKKKEAGGKE
jgi:NAD(P) transhydrogenase subunit alpha